MKRNWGSPSTLLEGRVCAEGSGPDNVCGIRREGSQRQNPADTNIMGVKKKE